MKKILLILLFSLAFITCKKEYQYPVPSFIGTWVSQDPTLQFTISNTNGIGSDIGFLVIKDTLEVRYYNEKSRYIVVGLTMRSMVLRASKGNNIYFIKTY